MNNFDEPSIYGDDYSVNKSFLGSYASRDTAADLLKKQMSNINDLSAGLDEILDKYEKIRKSTEGFKGNQEKIYDDLVALKKDTEEYNKNNIKDVNKTYEILTKLNQVRLKDLKEQRKEMHDLHQDTRAITYEIRQAEDIFASFKDETKEIDENLKNYNNRWSNLKTQLGTLKSDLGQMATLTGLDNIKNELQGKSGSWMDVRNNTMHQLGMVSNSEWNDFKNNLIGKVEVMNSNVGQAVYNADDVKTYMSKLTDLGIYDNKMAEAQLQAVIEGNKILGMSTETQANLLKLAKRSNNENLLSEMNNTFATLMNMDIGINREVLDQLAKSTSSAADILSFYGNGNAAIDLEKGAAYLTSAYGQNVANAASNVLDSLLREGVGSDAYVALGAENSNRIMNEAMYGNAGTALQYIVEASKNSGYLSTSKQNPFAFNALNPNSDLVALAGTGTAKMSYDEFTSTYNKKQATAKDIAEDKTLSVQEKIMNMLSLWLGKKSFITDANMANTFYWASLTYYSVSAISDISKLLKGKGLGEAILGNSKIKALGDGLTSALGKSEFGASLIGSNGLAAQVTAIAGSIGLIAGAVWTIKDGMDGYNKYKSGEWDKSKHDGFSSAIGGALGGTDSDTFSRILKNTGKYALVGMGIGSIVAPGPGTIIGAIVGALAGMALGAIGGENISTGLHGIGNFFGSLLGGKDKTGEDAKGGYSGNTSGLPIGGGGPSAPIVNSTAKGGAQQLRKYPWTRTSYFDEPRHYKWNGKWVDDRHNGVDLATSAGTPIGSNTSGVVTGAGTYKDGMNYFTVKDANGYTHIYYHMQQPPGFKVGETINAGQMFGKVGSTGQSTGPHLHYGLKNPGGTLIDPEPYITDNIFNPTADGNGDGTSTSTSIENGIALEDMFASKSIVPNLSRKLTSTDTKQTEAVLARYSGIGSGPDIISNITKSVDNGFSSLNAKLDELAERQDKSEEMLRSITSPSSNAMYKY